MLHVNTADDRLFRLNPLIYSENDIIYRFKANPHSDQVYQKHGWFRVELQEDLQSDDTILVCIKMQDDDIMSWIDIEGLPKDPTLWDTEQMFQFQMRFL